MTDLLSLVVRPETLRSAWEHVWERDGADGSRSSSVEAFARDSERHLRRLAGSVADGTFRPGRLFPVDIPEDDGGVRTLLVGAAADRVVERAVASVLTPVVDPHLSPASFAYRPGLGVGDAVRRLVALRRRGLKWVVRSDIDDCFGSIDHRLALRLLARWVDDRRILDLVAAFIAPSRRPRGHWDGIPQGGSVSPLLANVVLDQVDRAMLRRGFQMVRYADDMTVAVESWPEGIEALEVLMEQVGRVGLRLGEEDTEIVDYETGFAFLGEEFTTRYPPDSPPPSEELSRRTLYVGQQGAYLALRRGRVVVARRKAELLSVPASHVGRIVAAGSVGLSAGLRAWALSRGVGVVFLSRRGAFQGALVGPQSGAVRRRRRQYEVATDPGLCLAFATRIVEAKLRNQRSLLLRFTRRYRADEVARAADDIEELADMTGDAEGIDELNGLEGLAARRYFEAFGALLPEGVVWRGRHRRPPPDAVNAALSYGYAILEGEAETAVHIAGLDPGVGFLHAEHYGRSSLTLDLMEEFRPIVVDAVVLELFRRGSLTDRSVRVEHGKGGVLLVEKARRRLIGAVEERLLSVSKHLWSDRRTSRRRQIQLQAVQVARCIDRGVMDYLPVLWR